MQEVFPIQNRTQTRRAGEAVPDHGFQMCLSDIEGCADHLKETLSPGTAARYRNALLDFYYSLPKDKRVYEGSLAAWLESLKGRYSNYHLNMATSAYNAYLRYMGYESGRLSRYIVRQEPSDKEISREEYLRLLAMAKRLRKPLAYLAVRVYACTGIDTPALLAMTVEQVKEGIVPAEGRTIRLPDSLGEELLDYALHSGIRAGRLFIDRTGQPLNAGALRQRIKTVSRAAGFVNGVACARTLQKLYFAQRDELLSKEAERLMLEQIEKEQAEHGWEA